MSLRVEDPIIRIDIVRVVKREVSTSAYVPSRSHSYRYLRTSANQKLFVLSILLELMLFTSLSPANPFVTAR